MFRRTKKIDEDILVKRFKFDEIRTLININPIEQYSIIKKK